MNERTNRAKNLVVVGLQENVDDENIADRIQELFADKLELQDVAIANSRRLGQRKQNGSRPILVQLESANDKRKILQRRRSLAGSNIYINNDLTPEQQQVERKLRQVAKKLRESPENAGKKVTVYRGKVHIDRKPIPEALLQSLITPA